MFLQRAWTRSIACLGRIGAGRRALILLIVALVAGGLASATVDTDRLVQLARERYGPAAVATVEAWRALLAGSGQADEPTKLKRVNDFFNSRIRFDDDINVWGQADYWATPLETMGRGAGDCEDFAIAKYATLLELGVSSEKLRLIYVKALIGQPGSGIVQAHMVLGYYPTPTAEPLILDSLINEIRPASRRPDLIPVFSFNSDGLWVGGLTVNDPTARLSRWRDVLARMAEEGFK